MFPRAEAKKPTASLVAQSLFQPALVIWCRFFQPLSRFLVTFAAIVLVPYIHTLIPKCCRSKILRKAGSVCVCLFSHDILPHLYFRCQWTPHAPMTLKSQELCEHPRFWSLTWKRWLKIGLKHEFSKNSVTFIFASHEVAVCLLLKTIFGSNCLKSQLSTLNCCSNQVWLETWQDIKWPPHSLPLKMCCFFILQEIFSVPRVSNCDCVNARNSRCRLP